MRAWPRTLPIQVPDPEPHTWPSSLDSAITEANCGWSARARWARKPPSARHVLSRMMTECDGRPPAVSGKGRPPGYGGGRQSWTRQRRHGGDKFGGDNSGEDRRQLTLPDLTVKHRTRCRERQERRIPSGGRWDGVGGWTATDVFLEA